VAKVDWQRTTGQQDNSELPRRRSKAITDLLYIMCIIGADGVTGCRSHSYDLSRDSHPVG
jgi:hypothetical protein